MSDIPEDTVMSVRAAVYRAGIGGDDRETLIRNIIAIVNDAVNGERERCAAAAHEHIFDDHALAQATEFGRGCHHTATAIATAIRSERP